MPRRSPASSPAFASDRVALVAVRLTRGPRADTDRQLDETAGLVEAAGGAVVLRIVQERDRLDPATLLGAGKVATLAAACAEADVDLVAVDHELSPAQLRNLEKAIERPVVDRTQLILDIFAQRARTREGKLQVELAQLRYLLPRLVGRGVELSRLGGGIGTRGPGETKLETDRRRIRDRIAALTREIEDVKRRRGQLRERRHKSDVPTVALVGYTNAGKSTLFNLLAGASAAVSDALFVTLDPLIRQVRLPDRRQLLISDTVGFIERLPHTLVAAFRATLEEVINADLLLHVVDAATADAGRHIEAVRGVLREVGADAVPTIEVYNKIDLLDAAELAALRQRAPEALFISARDGRGRDALIARLTQQLTLETRRVTFEFDASSDTDRAQIQALYRQARVLRHEAVDGRVAIEADVPRRVLDRWLTTTATGAGS